MESNHISRDKFIKNIALIAMAVGMNPFELLSANHIPRDEVPTKLLAEAASEYQRFLRQTYNANSLSGTDEAATKRQYNALLHLMSISSDPKFEKYSSSKQVKKIKDSKPLENRSINEKQRQQIYKDLLDSSKAMWEGAAFAYTGTTAVVGTSIKVINYFNPAYKIVFEIPKGFKIANAVFGGSMAFKKGYNQFKNWVNSSAAVSAEVLRTNVYDRFLNTTDFSFEKEFTGLNFQISNRELNPALSPSANFQDPELKNVMQWIRDNISIGSVFTSKEDMEKFLGGYIDTVGKVQQQALSQVMDAKNKADARQMMQVREKSMLFDSVQNFIGSTILSNVAAPKEAEILNTLIGAGFQLAIAGSMGPLGIAAVGVSIATSLFAKRDNNGFQKALFKALKQIQAQLNVINEKIDVLHKNQTTIIQQLNEVISKLEDIEDLVANNFADLKAMSELIYTTILFLNRQELEDNYTEINNKLMDAVRDKQQEVLYINVQALRGLLGRLDNIDFTKYSNTDISGPSLKRQIYFSTKFKYNVSLYDSIGLLSGLVNYNPTLNLGTNDVPIVHPIEFLAMSSTMIDWMIVGKLSVTRNADLIRYMRDVATKSKNAINRLADKSIILDKSKAYLLSAEERISDIHSFLKGRQRADFILQPNSLSSLMLFTQKMNLEGHFVDQLNTAPAAFFNDKNDYPVLNLMSDMGIISEVKQSSSRPFITHILFGEFKDSHRNLDGYEPSFVRGSSCGHKINRIQFNHVLIDAANGKSISFSMDYRRDIIIVDYRHDICKHRACGHNGDSDCYMVDRIVTQTKTQTAFDPSWRQALRAELVRNGIDIPKLFPQFDSLTPEQLFTHLIDTWFKQKRSSYGSALIKYFSDDMFATFDATGTSLMVLSKLNQVVKSPAHLLAGIDMNNEISSIPYIIDYYDELFIKEDIVKLIEGIMHLDFDTKGQTLYKKVVDQYQASLLSKQSENFVFTLLDRESKTPVNLNPASFIDLVAILLLQKVQQTAESAVLRSEQLLSGDCEPYLRESLAKMDWFNQMN